MKSDKSAQDDYYCAAGQFLETFVMKAQDA